MSEHNDAANTDHEFDEPFPSMGIMQPDETPVWPLSRLVLAGVIITIILQVWLGALYYQYNSRETAQKNNEATDMLGASKTVGMVNSEAQQTLNAPAHIADADTGRLAIPIALAQKQVIAELTKDPEADVTGPPPKATPETAPVVEEDAKPEEKPAKEEDKEENKEENKEEKDSGEEEPAEAKEEPSEEKAAEENPAQNEAAEEKPAEEKAEESEESTATEEEPSAEPEAAKDE